MTARAKRIRKLGDKRILQCICGRYIRTRKSRFAAFDIGSGLFLIAIVTAALAVKAPAALLLVVLPLVLIPWALFFVISLARGHAPKCAARWAAIVVVGSIGGNWF